MRVVGLGGEDTEKGGTLKMLNFEILKLFIGKNRGDMWLFL